MGIGDVLSEIVTGVSVSAPTTYPLSLGTPETERLFDAIPCHSAPLEKLHGMLVSNGIDPMRHIVADDWLRTGILPPSGAMTASPSGTQATAEIDFDRNDSGAANNPPNNATMVLGQIIQILDTLPTVDTGTAQIIYIKRESAGEDTLLNIAKMVDGTGVSGTHYFPSTNSSGIDPVEWVRARFDISASDYVTDYSITVRVKEYGSAGNSHQCYLASGSWADTSAGDSDDTAVGTQEFFSGGANGNDTGDGPASGDYRYAQSYVRTKDGGVSAIGEFVSASFSSSMDIDLASLTASGDADVDFTRWWRTLVDGKSFYRGADIEDSGTTDTDNLSDANLTAAGKSIRYSAVEHRPYSAGFPPKYRIVVEHLGRIFGAGAILAADITATISFTNDSDEATVTSGVPTERWVGRWVFPTTGDQQTKPQLVVGVNAGTKVLTLATTFDGTTGSLVCTVKDQRNPLEIGWSAFGKPNQWPVTNTLEGVSSDHPDGIVAMREFQESLVIWTRDGLWVLVGDSPGSFQIRKISGDGCVSQRSVVETDSALFWLGPDGIYAWSGGEDAERLSYRPVAQGIHETIKRINDAHSHWIHGEWNVSENVIAWGVPLDNDITCRHAIVLDIGSLTFSLDTRPDSTTTATVIDPTGDRAYLMGTASGDLIQTCKSNSDLAYGVEVVHTIDTGATTRSIPLTGSPGLSSLAGTSGVLVTVAGDFIGFEIGSNTADTLTLARHLDAAPASGDKVILGGIHMRMTTGHFHLGVPMQEKNIPVIDVAYAPDSGGYYFISKSDDQESFAIPEFGDSKGDLTSTRAAHAHDVNMAGRLQAWQIDALIPGCDPTFLAVEMNLTSWGREATAV